MNANTLEELLVYEKAVQAAAAVAPILERRSLNRDPRLRDQLASASERVVSAIAEGFEMSTDKHFAAYLYRAKGSSRELRSQLVIAVQRQHVSEDERVRISSQYEEVSRMLDALIGYLENSNRKNRRKRRLPPVAGD